MRPMVTHGCHRSFKKNMTVASENTISSCFFYLILMAANFCFARCKFCKCGLFWESSSPKSPPSSRYNISSNLHIATFSKKRYFLRKKDCELSLHSVPSYDAQNRQLYFAKKELFSFEDPLESGDASLSQEALIHSPILTLNQFHYQQCFHHLARISGITNIHQ